MLGTDARGDVQLGMLLDPHSAPIKKSSKKGKGLHLQGMISLLLISGGYLVIYSLSPEAGMWYCNIAAVMLVVFFIYALFKGW